MFTWIKNKLRWLLIGGVALAATSTILVQDLPTLGGDTATTTPIVINEVMPTDGEDVKADKDKIIKVKEEEKVVEYSYISSEKSKKKLYFADGAEYALGEYLPKRADGKEPLAFYAEPIAYKNPITKEVFDIKKATTTKDVFYEQTAVTFKEVLLDIFFNTANATTTYTSSTTWTPPSAGIVEYLVIGGGGGGSGGNNSSFCGGGGAAGIARSGAGYPVTVQEYTITVGAKGAGSPASTPSDGGDGGSSVFDTIIATGGRGQHYTGNIGGDNDDYAGGTGGLGFKGGGGAGSAGAGNVDDGGAATSSTISGSLVYYAEGGADSYGQTIHGGGESQTNCSGANGGDATSYGSGGGGSGYVGKAGDGKEGIIIIAFTASGGGGDTSITSDLIWFE